MNRNATRESDRDDDAVMEQAFDWLILLRENPGAADLRAARDTWMAADPAHARAYARAEAVWATTGQVGNQAGSMVAERRETPRRRFRRAAAFGAMAAALFVALALPTLRLMISADHFTGTGETRQVVLEDGSKVALNADSAIRLHFTLAKREVELLRGDAFFAVTPDASRPFSVRAASVTTTVLGTEFAVQNGSDELSVAVEGGRVRVDVTTAGTPSTSNLVRGDQIIVDRDSGQSRRTNIDVSEVAAWRRGQLVVVDATLDHVVEELSRHFRGKIVVTGGLGAKRVTGVYDLRDTDGALRAAVLPFAATVRSVTPYLLVVSAY